MIKIENVIQHSDCGEENSFFEQIKCGNTKEVERQCENRPVSKMSALVSLSKNTIQNIKYHLVVTVALAIRSCIDGGMAQEEAYSLSDKYIRELDECTEVQELDLLHKAFCSDLSKRMKSYLLRSYSPAIKRCIDFLLANIRKPISLEDAADVTGVHPKYLCVIFKKATGMTVDSFVKTHRIAEAKDMLANSSMSVSSIGSSLCFSSQSHFSSVFKKYTGKTPVAYRNESY